MIQSIDHIVITCRDLAATIDFYTRALGMHLETFGEPPKPQRKALRFGDQKFNLHQAGDANVTDIYARTPTPGSLDLCLIAAAPLDDEVEGKDASMEVQVRGRATTLRWRMSTDSRRS